MAIILATAPTIEGRPARDYLGIVTGEVIVGANIFKDLFAGIRDIVDGRLGSARCARSRFPPPPAGEATAVRRWRGEPLARSPPEPPPDAPRSRPR